MRELAFHGGLSMFTELAKRNIALLGLSTLMGVACSSGPTSTANNGAAAIPPAQGGPSAPAAMPSRPTNVTPPTQTPAAGNMTPAMPARPAANPPPTPAPVSPAPVVPPAPTGMTGTGGAAAPDMGGAGADLPAAPPADCKKGEVKGSEVLIIG